MKYFNTFSFQVVKYLTDHCEKSDIFVSQSVKSLSYLQSGTKIQNLNLDYLKPKTSSENSSRKELQNSSPLVMAIIHEDILMLKLLLKAGADLHLLNDEKDELTPLMHAVKTNNTQIVKTILSFDGDEETKEAKNDGFYIALAADKNYVLEASVDRNEQSNSGTGKNISHIKYFV